MNLVGRAPDLPRLAVVVSTFDRPDALTFALRSVVRQTMRDWVAFVIGDCCDERTAAAVAGIGDPRLRFFNLPVRCGDQSGPNSIGASMCRSPFLAFVNHDDLLLPDHFERALGSLDATDADMCFGGVLRVDTWADPKETEEPPLFVRERSRKLSVLRAFPPPSAHVYEPVSAWVVRRIAYERVGEWRDGFELHRPPFGDWLLRACRVGLTSCVLDRPTVVRPLTHNEFRGEGGVYRASAEGQRSLDGRLEAMTGDEFRDWAARGGSGGRAARVRLRLRWYATHFGARRGFLLGVGLRRGIRPLLPAALAPFAALYLVAGIDAYTAFCRLLGRRRGSWKRWMLAYRTRTVGLRPADRASLLAAARAHFGDAP